MYVSALIFGVNHGVKLEINQVDAFRITACQRAILWCKSTLNYGGISGLKFGVTYGANLNKPGGRVPNAERLRHAAGNGAAKAGAVGGDPDAGRAAAVRVAVLPREAGVR